MFVLEQSAHLDALPFFYPNIYLNHLPPSPPPQLYSFCSILAAALKQRIHHMCSIQAAAAAAFELNWILSLSPYLSPFLFSLYIYIYLYPGHPSSSFHPIRSPIVHTFLYSSSFILCIYFHIALWLLVPLDASSERPRRYYPKNWIERGEIKTFNDKYICSPFLPCRSFYLSGCRQKKKINKKMSRQKFKTDFSAGAQKASISCGGIKIGFRVGTCSFRSILRGAIRVVYSSWYTAN